MEPLLVHLFGGFFLQQGERTLTPISSRAVRSLLYRNVLRQRRAGIHGGESAAAPVLFDRNAEVPFVGRELETCWIPTMDSPVCPRAVSLPVASGSPSTGWRPFMRRLDLVTKDEERRC